MASVRVVALAAAAVTLAGCAAPAQTHGADRAVALYREGLRPWASTTGNAARGQLPGAGDPRAATRTPGSLTADEAVALAKANSARLSSLRALVEEAAASVDVAGAFPNPELRISQLQLDQILAGRAQERTSLRVSLPRPGEIGAEVADARVEEAEARAELRAEETTIEADVRWLFDDVLMLDAQIAAAEAVAAARAALAAQTKARLEASEASALDDATAELTAVEAEQDRAELTAERNVATGTLLSRIGLDPAAEVRIVGDPPNAWPPPPLPGEQVLVEAALRARPEILMAAARIDASSARISAAHAMRWPWFSFLELGYEVAPKIRPGLGWTFQAGIELPIFNTNRAGVTAAETAQAAAKHGLAAEVELVTFEVRSLLRAVRSAETLVTDLRRRALPVTERAATAVRRALASEGVDVMDALKVDERRVRMELRLVTAIRNYRTAVSELRRAVGGHLPAASGAAQAPHPISPAGAPPKP